MFDIYQFIKYNSETTIESIKKKGESGAVICFDLEDSIYNWIDETEGNNLKQKYRKWLNRIIAGLNEHLTPVKIGIRINSFESGQQQFDLDSIPRGSKIHSLLIPKVEDSFQIDTVADGLVARNIVVNELIPIIESRKGLINLRNIIGAKYQVSKVGFGHCDYNLSIGAFPFFHQDTLEYWKWISVIIGVLRIHNIKFIHSAYLNLDDSAFFRSMLSHLHCIAKDNFGQFTLSHQQTLLCNSFTQQITLSEAIAKNRLDLCVNKQMFSSLISAFEECNKGQGFTVSPDRRILISPQEYKSAKLHFQNWKEKSINFTFVGGCFPVQGDILFEDIFHQTLKRNVEKNLNVNFQVNIIRYERFSNCLEKIANSLATRSIDYLVFHIRPEPYLRLSKLYYKYLDTGFKLRRSLNLPFMHILNPEKYDLLMLSRKYEYIENKKPILYNALINLNYIFGYIAGNQNYALKKYLCLAEEVIGFCDNHTIKLIILGPAMRSSTIMEKIFSKKLERFISGSLRGLDIKYVFGQEKHRVNGKKYFKDNGIHATELYHDLIAGRLFQEIEAGFKIE